MISIRVQAGDFDPGIELAAVAPGDAGVGGIASFIGLVRDFGPASAMTLEHYPGMTERQLQAIAEEAASRWPLAGVRLVHRFGRLVPGDRIVFAAAASAHRKAVFEACEFLVDWLKTKAPFWKLEESGGQRVWVEAREADAAAAKRWSR